MNEESIFAEALEKSPDERAAFLDKACGEDVELRSDVESLLVAYDEGAFLEHPAGGIGATTEHEVFEQPGAQIGPYKLLKVLGQGGMGVVYLSQQKTPVERLAALKVIKPGMDTQRIIKRFEAERQALEVMDHPSVAKVLDAGATESGRPYFVMELVKGTRITKYCDDHKLSVRERLELFIPVCQAVQHAHQKGIIHRDIKPSNILVTEFDGQPVPKVIDFGVAKAVDQRATQRQMSTQYGQIVGTLEYMSPEQARLNQQDVDTRSDVYSLGAVLYELLTGITPFDKEQLYSAAFDEALHIIEQQEPSKPSTRLISSDSLPSVAALRHTEPQRLTGTIRGELDWIVMKSLEKDRSRRYESAASLARDIVNYIQDKPVNAGPPSTGYRLRKFARRNKNALIAASLVALTLVVGTGIATWQAVSAHRQAARAEKEKSRAEATLRISLRAVDDMYTQVADKHLFATPMSEPMTAQVLEGAIRFYTNFANLHQSDTTLHSEKATALMRVGCCHQWLGELAEAELALRAAVLEFEQLTTDSPDSAQYQMGLASCCIALADLLGSRAQHVPAEALFKRAVATLDPLQETLGSDVEFRICLSRALCGLGWHYIQVGSLDEATEHYVEAIKVKERLAVDFPDDKDRRAELALSYRGLARVFEASGRNEEAVLRYDKTIALLENVASLPPVDPYCRLHLSLTYRWYGALLERSGPWRGAEGQYRKSEAVSAQLAEDFPHVPAYRDSWRDSYFLLAQLLKRNARWQEAEGVYQEIIDRAEDLVTRWPTIPSFKQQLCTVHTDYAHLLLSGRLTEAGQHLKRAITLAHELDADRGNVPENLALLARAKAYLGWVHLTAERLPEAEQAARQANLIFNDLVNGNPANVAFQLELSFSHRLLARVTQKTSRLEEAEQHYRKCLDVQEALLEANIDQAAEFLAITYAQFGDFLQVDNRVDEAERVLRQAVGFYDALIAEFPNAISYQRAMADAMRSLIGVAYYYFRLNQNEKGKQLLADTLSLRHRITALDMSTGSSITSAAAAVYFLIGSEVDALKLYADEIETRRDILADADATTNPASSETLDGMNALAWLLATCPCNELRDPQESVRLASELVARCPTSRRYLNTLGAAQYRTGQYEAAIETLHQAMALESGLPYDFIFLSMAYGKLGDSEKSRDWYEKAVSWKEKTAKYAPEIHVYRQEAAELLQLNKQNKPNEAAPTLSAS